MQVSPAPPALAEEAPPAPLACLARHYALTAERDAAGWWARLPDGKRVPYDDGEPRSFDEQLDRPDIKDWFSIRYRPGAIRPVTVENEDPGRIRVTRSSKPPIPPATPT